MSIESRKLGRTGLEVSLLGLGGGGNSRLGLSNGQSEAHAADVVRAALDLGINMIDTARGYGTERPLGQALKGRLREAVVISSKSPYLDPARELLTPQAFLKNLETSLKELGLEMIDIYFIHGLQLSYYESSKERFLPVLEAARQAGKIRYFGVTEGFETDTGHKMLQRAVQDEVWDLVMVGFNLLNPSARQRVLAFTRQNGMGTLGMFAIRRGLIDENLLRVLLQRLAESGEVPAELAAAPDLMEVLGLQGVAGSLSEAAYRFSAYEPGMDCVLSGTSSAAHLQENLKAVQRGPLPPATLERLEQLFDGIDSVSGQVR